MLKTGSDRYDKSRDGSESYNIGELQPDGLVKDKTKSDSEGDGFTELDAELLDNQEKWEQKSSMNRYPSGLMMIPEELESPKIGGKVSISNPSSSLISK